jgi:hypothetical protein
VRGRRAAEILEEKEGRCEAGPDHNQVVSHSFRSL